MLEAVSGFLRNLSPLGFFALVAAVVLGVFLLFGFVLPKIIPWPPPRETWKEG